MDLYKIRQRITLGEPLSNINLKVTFYSRVSTEHQEQKNSLKNQTDFFIKMITENRNWTYIDGYIDEGISGTSDLKRINFMKMIEDAKNNKFDLIITKEISRFSRNTLDSIKYSRELLSYGVAILFINDNINTILPDSELRLTIMASLAQDEIRRLSERVKFGMKESIRKGNILGNDMTYGYKKDLVTKKLEIIKAEAKIVKRIFNLYIISKKSLNEIAKILNAEKIKTRQNNRWTATTLSRMIRNIKYKGYYCGRKTEIIDYMTKKVKYLPKNEWVVYKDIKKIPPIIEETIWDKANRRLEKNKVNKKINDTKHKYSQKLICKKDNHIFHRRNQHISTKDFTWLCSLYLKKGKVICNSPNIRENELNEIMKSEINNIDINYQKLNDFMIEVYENKKELIDLLKDKITKEALNDKIQKILIEKIVVEKISEEDIRLEIYINYNKKHHNQKKYTFPRMKKCKGLNRKNINYIVTIN